ncbi:MAG TPA: tRNA-(ms[2]io[6]A)-hydroxylase [Myxococcota bacterium]|nr:tRNA-(ms[2]io[6]A)-hydroxylase [Myxococcota bacterium]
MLSLASATPPAWAARALADLELVLLDHAHCEKKAAGNAVTLMFRYPQHGFLAAPLSRLAREELVHFEQVLERLAAGGLSLRPLKASPYAGRLRAAARADEPDRLLDSLLCSALIEARSCERFRLLAEHAPDASLREFYGGLLASEARHHGIFVALATQLATPEVVRARLDELARHEAEVLAGLPPMPRLHA